GVAGGPLGAAGAPRWRYVQAAADTALSHQLNISRDDRVLVAERLLHGRDPAREPPPAPHRVSCNRGPEPARPAVSRAPANLELAGAGPSRRGRGFPAPPHRARLESEAGPRRRSDCTHDAALILLHFVFSQCN